MKYDRTGLWSRTFSVPVGDVYTQETNDLAAQYRKFWNNAVELAKQIQKDIPNLTLHDEAHFQSLWYSSDIIAGPHYLLNPLETYVLGGAILIHDSGHAVATFPGGLAELQSTPVWRDAVLAELVQARNEDLPDEQALSNPSESVQRAALFTTLRTFHAHKAAELATLELSRPDGGTVRLIEDDQLRTHLGELIGIIAASHHWDLQKVATDLASRRGPPAGFPGTWTIDPLKIACLLRCADAIQIDQTRAPDFLYSILKISGISEEHWRAQNRLAKPMTDAVDQNAIVFTSTKSFGQEDADSWWIARDAIAVADSELQNCAVMMRDLNRAPFKITRVRDAGSPERLSTHIRVKGWRPIPTEIRIGPAKSIIDMMGGSQLYGQSIIVPLRELIQNSADAIRARRKEEPGYKGRILVRLEEAQEDGKVGFWLRIEDDGLGMSEQVLVGPLLEFGTSYWTSNMIRAEYPGLAAQVRRQTGRFGIGFFSVLMITKRILVTSRPYTSGIKDFRTLSFRKGLDMRPLLLDSSQGVPISVSTRVSLFISKENLDNLLTFRTDPTAIPVVADLKAIVAHVCPCLDADVYVSTPNVSNLKAHAQDWYSGDRLAWLREINLANLRSDSELDVYLEKISPFLTEFRTENVVDGLAAINFRHFAAGVGSIGGLIAGRDAKSLSQRHIWAGAIATRPEGPRRNGEQVAVSPEEFSDWASKQATALANTSLARISHGVAP